jgi:hypothetical protein
VSESDSFINEVTEEVRRERLYSYLRRYGWIGIAVVLLLVGGAAYNEYRKATEMSVAQALGDQMLDALEVETDADRAAALAAIDVKGKAVAVAALLTASEQERAGDLAGAMATLDALAVNADVDQMYRDLAQIKSLMVGAGLMDPAERMAALEAIAAPGAPYRLLAMEQIAFSQISSGETEAALGTLAAIAEDADVSSSLQQRAQSLIIALGGEPPALPGADAATEPAVQD